MMYASTGGFLVRAFALRVVKGVGFTIQSWSVGGLESIGWGLGVKGLQFLGFWFRVIGYGFCILDFPVQDSYFKL
jgi:hypothetical protein